MKLYREFKSQEEIDHEYNLAQRVPDMGYYMEWYKSESSKARNELDCELDVSYGPSVDETVDVFPSKEKDAPVLIFIHGGYWFGCTEKDFSLVARGPVSHGVTVVVMNYSHCPKVTIAEITRQSRSVIAWLYREAKNFNADPERIFAAGHSAGGHQVGMLAITDWQGDYGLPGDIIKGGISLSGIFDLRPLRYSYLQPKLLLSHEDILHQSPYLNVPRSGPPLLVTFGKEETAEYHRQSTEFLNAWRAKGMLGQLLIQEGKHHFSAIEGLNSPESLLCNAFIDFMKRCEKL